MKICYREKFSNNIFLNPIVNFDSNIKDKNDDTV